MDKETWNKETRRQGETGVLPESISTQTSTDVQTPTDLSTGTLPDGVTPPDTGTLPPLGTTPSDNPTDVQLPADLSSSPLPPVETGVQVLEVAPPEGWRPSEDGSIDVFIKLCYNKGTEDEECGSSEDPGSLDALKDKYEKVSVIPTGGEGNENPGDKDEPVVPMPDVPGVTKEDVETFVNFTLDLIEKSLEAKNETMTPKNRVTAAKGISEAISNGEVSPEAIQAVADMANGKLEGATMFVFLKGTAVITDSGHTAFGVMTPDGRSLLSSKNGTNTPNDFKYGLSAEQMFTFAQTNGYTRVYTNSTSNYDFDAALETTIVRVSSPYSLPLDNCAHATEAVLEAFTADSPNDIRNYGLFSGEPINPQTWAKKLETEDGWAEIPLFKSNGTVRSNDNVYVPSCSGFMQCSIQKFDPNFE